MLKTPAPMLRHRRLGYAIGLLVLVTSLTGDAQQWSGVISPSRATDWSAAGVSGGIPSRTTICSTLSPGATASQINAAIGNCPAGQVVKLNAGIYNLTAGIELDTDNVTLRGAGANSTILNINGSVGVGCHLGDDRAFNICKNGSNIGVDSPDNTATWSAGYSQGTSTITISSKTNLSVGSTIWLDQLDDASDGFPAAGDVWLANWGAGDSYVRNNRGLVEGHIVTSVEAGTCAPNCDIGISPPIMMPNIRSGQSPGAWWGNTGSVLNGAGVEDLTIDSTGNNSNAIYMVNCTNCYVKGVRTLYRNTVSSGQFRINNFINVVNGSVVDSYFYGPQSSSLVSVYGIATHVISHSLFQNNIIHGSVNPFVINSSTYGSVFSYNLFDNVGVSASFSQSTFILHGHAAMNLFEGNNGRNFSGDNIHTSHFFNTIFRNHFDGTLRNPSSTETGAGVALYAAQRFFNVVGNVMGASNWSTYQNGQSPPSHCPGCVYELGWQGTNTNAAATTGNDTNVSRTLMRWGNWDSVSSTNDNGSNDTTGTRFVASEVPSSITNFPNPVPSSLVLPASLYLSAKPFWFGAVAWPPVGPDVSNSTITTSTGGHANKIPARLCFEAAANDPAYASSGPRIKLFDAASCYGGGAPAPTTPTWPASPFAP